MEGFGKVYSEFGDSCVIYQTETLITESIHLSNFSCQKIL